MNLLDRLVDEVSIPDLVAALDDTHVAVRCPVLHALAFDTSKDNACRPDEDLFVPRAIECLSDTDPDLRAAAIDALGTVAGHRTDAAAALVGAAGEDPDRDLRGMAEGRISRLRLGP